MVCEISVFKYDRCHNFDSDAPPHKTANSSTCVHLPPNSADLLTLHF